jgi:hypothetical protein
MVNHAADKTPHGHEILGPDSVIRTRIGPALAVVFAVVSAAVWLTTMFFDLRAVKNDVAWMKNHWPTPVPVGDLSISALDVKAHP